MRGFTLVEIIIVVGIFTLIIAMGMVMDLGTFKRDLFHSEVSTVVSVLERARSRSMANMYQSAHGVCYAPPNYIIFRDGTCDGSGTDELIPSNPNITITFTPAAPIIFGQLSGNTTVSSIHITDGIKSTDININSEGTINW